MPPVSYATDQVHFKHEQPQVLLLESHVKIGTIQQTQDAANVLWVHRHNSWHASYWDSWKLFGRLWRYHHERWI